MFLTTQETYALTSSLRLKDYKDNIKNDQTETPLSQVYLLKAVVESFVDGILIVTDQGDLVHENECAKRICDKLNKNKDSLNKVPEEIWRVCQSLINNSKQIPEDKIYVEYEINICGTVKLRVRVRWLEVKSSEQKNLLLVTLEDLNQTSQSVTLADATKYNLTSREAEVWLLRRANFSYKEIADKLYITINTVKKHLKNVYAKQQEVMC